MILESARGCEHKCSFCTQWNHWGGQWRTKSAKRVAKEIEYLYNNYGGIFLWFTDDNIRIKQRGKQFYQVFKNQEWTDDVMLFFQARTDDVSHHPKLVENLREIGTYWIMCGIEHHLPETLKEYQKGTTNKDAYQAMKILNDNDIFSHAMFVIGNRKDTAESIDQLREFSSDVGPDFAIFTALTPFPGTQYYELAQQNGWIEDENFSNYDMAHAIMPTETLTRQDVQRELWLCYKQFYGSYRKNIAGIFSSNQLKRTLYRHMAGQHVLSKLRRLI
jgi:anaerobic magnesium-protoporphyrin IX monomethyl ester cyclase